SPPREAGTDHAVSTAVSPLHEAAGRVVGASPFRMLIGGRLVAALDEATAATVDPATERELAEVAAAGAAGVDRAVRAAADAFPAWRDLRVADRVGLVRRVLEAIEAHQEPLALLDAVDSGNPISAMRSDAALATRLLEPALGWAANVRGET